MQYASQSTPLPEKNNFRQADTACFMNSMFLTAMAEFSQCEMVKSG